MNLFEETKFIMNKYKIQAKKNLGQNFLIDETIVDEIIENSEICKDDLVIEIGPGLGTLTSKLLESAGKVIAIELDENVLQILNDRFKLYNNFELINQDILKTDLNNLINSNLANSNHSSSNKLNSNSSNSNGLTSNNELKNCKIVANLPYYITTPIITKLLEEKLNISSITVMVQKEVANRLTKVPGKDKDVGSISYYIYYYSDAKIVLDAPRFCFHPSPDVDSSVINLKLLKEPRIKTEDEEFLFKVIKLAFSQKRKTLSNSLVNNNVCSSKQELENILLDLNINPKARSEELSLQDFENICKKLKSK